MLISGRDILNNISAKASESSEGQSSLQFRIQLLKKGDAPLNVGKWMVVEWNVSKQKKETFSYLQRESSCFLLLNVLPTNTQNYMQFSSVQL